MHRFLFILSFFSLFLSTRCQEPVPKQKKNKWGYVNKSGEWVIKPKYDIVQPFSEGLACVQKKGKWGYLNKEGERVTKLIYSDAHEFKNGLAAVRSLKLLPGDNRYNHNQYRWGFINSSGELVIDYIFKEIDGFDVQGRCLVSLFGMKKGERFWINKEGKAISPPFLEYKEQDGIVKLKHQREDGQFVYKYIFANGTPITKWYLNDFSLPGKGNLTKVWLPSQTEQDTLPANAFKGNGRRKLCSFIDFEGKEVCDWFSEINEFRFGFAPVRKNHLYGFVDSSFVLVTPLKYREVEFLYDSTYKAQLTFGKTVLLNYKGKEKSYYCFDFKKFNDTIFTGIHELKSKYRKERKEALFNDKGKQITGWYNKIHAIHNGISRVEDERATRAKNETNSYETYYNYIYISSGDLLSDWRIADRITWQTSYDKRDSILTFLYFTPPDYWVDNDFFSTVFIQEFHYDKKGELLFSGGDFHNGMALISKPGKRGEFTRHGVKFETENKLFGYIDWYGKEIISPRYKQASAFRARFAVVGNGTKYGVINSKGRQVVPYKYKMLGAHGDGVLPFLSSKSKWGYISTTGKIKIEALYDEALPFSYGYAPVKKGKNWGIINLKGEEVFPFELKKPAEIYPDNKAKILQNGVGYKNIKL